MSRACNGYQYHIRLPCCVEHACYHEILGNNQEYAAVPPTWHPHDDPTYEVSPQRACLPTTELRRGVGPYAAIVDPGFWAAKQPCLFLRRLAPKEASMPTHHDEERPESGLANPSKVTSLSDQRVHLTQLWLPCG